MPYTPCPLNYSVSALLSESLSCWLNELILPVETELGKVVCIMCSVYVIINQVGSSPTNEAYIVLLKWSSMVYKV